MFTVQFYSGRTKCEFVQCSGFSAQTSKGLINLFRPVLRMLDSTWFIDWFVQGSRALPSPAESVHTGRTGRSEAVFPDLQCTVTVLTYIHTQVLFELT